MDNNEKILIETKERSITNQKRLDIVEEELKELKSEQKAIYEIASSLKVLVERVGYIEGKVNETSHKIDQQSDAWRLAETTLSAKISEAQSEKDHNTARNVDSIKLAAITAFITALATGIVTYIFHF